MTEFTQEGKDPFARNIAIGVTGVVMFVGVLMWGLPTYSVWQQGLKGEAKLQLATQTKKIIIQQAEAEKSAAALRASAIEIVGAASQKYPEYRQQEFIGAFGTALENGTIEQIIYVPTEAMIPIMEAGKR